MGFKLMSDQQRVRISLSETAFLVTREDMLQFHVASRSSFMNTVFRNFREEAEASVSRHLDARREELRSVLDAASSDSSCDRVIRQLLLSEEQRLKDRILRQKRDRSKNEAHKKETLYRVSNENLAYLESEECLEETYYEGKPGLYLKCILEEYASLPYIKREQIFFQGKYDLVREAIERSLLLKITTSDKKTYTVWPYCLEADALSTREYLIGLSRDSRDKNGPKRCVSFRIPNADSIRILRQSGHISKQEADRIQKDIANRNVQFLAGSDEQILVRLTEDGVRKYQSQIYLRPSCSQAITGEGDYSFFCTPRQAEYYFFKFGKDAEILSPPGLRERFLSLYADALKTYREPQGSRAS